MPSETLNLEARIKTLNTVLTEKHDRQTVDEALRAAKGDMSAALESLKGKLPDAALKKVALAHSLAVWSDDRESEGPGSHCFLMAATSCGRSTSGGRRRV